jgi:hypothetical protein
MSDEFGKDKADVEKLDQMGRLVDKYAQSRSLPMLLLLPIIVFNAILLITTIEVAGVIDKSAWLLIFILVFLWVLFSSLWLQFIILKRYGSVFYKTEGEIVLEREKVPIWAWATYGVTFVGPAFFEEFNIMSVRWALMVSLISFGMFMLYVGKKQKEIMLCIVYGILVLSLALVTALGFVEPFGGEKWKHAFFVTLIAYLIGAGLVTAIVVHIYNRKILRKIKELRPFSGQETSKSDS